MPSITSVTVKFFAPFTQISTWSGMTLVAYSDRIPRYSFGKKVSDFWNHTVLCDVNEHLLCCSFLCVDRQHGSDKYF